MLPSTTLPPCGNRNKWVGERKVGKRLPTLKSLLDSDQTDWQTLTIEGWYGGRACSLQVTSQTAVWYHTGLPAVPIRWVLVKDPTGKEEPQTFLSTDLSATPEQVLRWFRYSLASGSHL